jgi:hypothetical protein
MRFLLFVVVLFVAVYFTNLRYQVLPVQAVSYTSVLVKPDLLQHLNAKFNARLTGRIFEKSTNKLLFAQIDFFDSDGILKASLSLKDILALGWSVDNQSYGLIFTKGALSITVIETNLN